MTEQTFFSPRVDALLQEWLSTPRWHIDRPSENAKFYRFAAALMQEAGQPDIREVMAILREAGRTWATDYDNYNGDARVEALCDRLQVLYDFFGALQAGHLPPVAPPTTPLPPPVSAPRTSSTVPLVPEVVNSAASRRKKCAAPQPSTADPPPQAQIALLPATLQAPPEPKPSAHQAAPPEVVPVPKKGGRRGREVVVEQSEANDEFPSQERMQAFWAVVLRLYDVLAVRRGESPPPAPSPNDTEAVVAEMQRRAAEVLHAEEITGAEKRDLISTIIDKVVPHRKDDGAVYVEVEWLK